MIYQLSRWTVVHSPDQIRIADAVRWINKQGIARDHWTYLGKSRKDKVAWEFKDKNDALLFKLAWVV